MQISSEFYVFLLTSSILGLTFGLLGVILGAYALIKNIAAEKSTHTVTYQPIDQEVEKANEEFLGNSWATDQTTLVKQNEMFKEDLEEDMPDFYPDEKETKIHSF